MELLCVDQNPSADLDDLLFESIPPPVEEQPPKPALAEGRLLPLELFDGTRVSPASGGDAGPLVSFGLRSSACRLSLGSPSTLASAWQTPRNPSPRPSKRLCQFFCRFASHGLHPSVVTLFSCLVMSPTFRLSTSLWAFGLARPQAPRQPPPHRPRLSRPLLSSLRPTARARAWLWPWSFLGLLCSG